MFADQEKNHSGRKFYLYAEFQLAW